MSERLVRQVHAGAGKQAVVLEAGRGNGAASWDRVIALLAPHLRVAAYDRAGLGGSAPVTMAAIRELRAADRPFTDVPVVMLSAARGVPRRFRAHWTSLQAGLAASAPHGRHVIVERTGHSIPRKRPDAVADAILAVAAQIPAFATYFPLGYEPWLALTSRSDAATIM